MPTPQELRAIQDPAERFSAADSARDKARLPGLADSVIDEIEKKYS